MQHLAPASLNTPSRYLVKARKATAILLSKRKAWFHLRWSPSSSSSSSNSSLMVRFRITRPTVALIHRHNNSNNNQTSNIRLLEASLTLAAGPKWVLSLCLINNSSNRIYLAKTCHLSNLHRMLLWIVRNKLLTRNRHYSQLRFKRNKTTALGITPFSQTW